MATKKSSSKMINLALQGGGAHGAFTWGVLDRLLEDERVAIEAITGTSAGAVNACVCAYGMLEGGRQHARELLGKFWHKVSHAASMSPLQPTIMDKMFGNNSLEFSPSFMAVDYMTRMFSPYQLNLFNINPLRTILEETVSFERLQKNKEIKLFINATNVRTGKIKVFKTPELTLDMVMASACLPFLYKTVEIDGEAYWDGGYSGNPALYPLFYECTNQDVVIVQINPLRAEEVPTNAADILDRVNEISFNTTLMREVRAIAFVQKLFTRGKLDDNDPYKDVRLHMIEAEEIMSGLTHSSKLNADWDFLQHLFDVGRQSADDWLHAHYDKIGKETSIDLKETFL